jgi:hypothetical protein
MRRERHSTVLLDSLVRLFKGIAPEEPMSAATAVEMLEEEAFYRFRGRERSRAIELTQRCLDDGFVFENVGAGLYRLRDAFR